MAGTNGVSAGDEWTPRSGHRRNRQVGAHRHGIAYSGNPSGRSKATEGATIVGLQPDVRYVLSAQLAATPPDETPGLHHVRDLTEAEAAQFREDLELIRSVASIAPYARAVTAYRQLVELVEGLKPDAKGRPSARGAAQLRQALSAVSHAFRELPDQLADALAKRLGSEAPGAGRLDGAISGFKLEPACRLISALPTVPAHGFVLHGADARRDVLVDASSWAESTGDGRRRNRGDGRSRRRLGGALAFRSICSSSGSSSMPRASAWRRWTVRRFRARPRSSRCARLPAGRSSTWRGSRRYRSRRSKHSSMGWHERVGCSRLQSENRPSGACQG